MKEFLFVFKQDSVISEVKIKAITEKEACRLLNLLVKINESEITKVICIDEN